MNTVLENIRSPSVAKKIYDHVSILQAQVKEKRHSLLDIARKIDSISNNMSSLIDFSSCLLQIMPCHLSKRDSNILSGHIKSINSLMASLNQDQELYLAMRQSLNGSSERSSEAYQVIHSYVENFEQHGIQKSLEDRSKIKDLLKEIHYFGSCYEKMCMQRSKHVKTHLESLLDRRMKLGHAVGFSSYGHMMLQKSGFSSFDKIDEMIKVDYVNCVISNYESFNNRPRDTASKSISVLNFLERLSLLLKNLFGAEFSVEFGDFLPNLRCWKLKFTNSDNGYHMGTVYLDLLKRQGKLSNPCHFTLLSRKKDALDNFTYAPILEDAKEQHPIVLISCSFKHAEFLQFDQARSLMHEMGHAFHGIIRFC